MDSRTVRIFSLRSITSARFLLAEFESSESSAGLREGRVLMLEFLEITRPRGGRGFGVRVATWSGRCCADGSMQR
jgi:hypothetical protein